MVLLVVSSIIFGIFSLMIIKKYGNELKQELGYRLWSLGLATELAIAAHAFSGMS